MISREIEAVVKEWSGVFKSLTITGPRQSGKTTLARKAFPDLPYLSLENPDIRERAETDPRGFLAQYKGGMILDEVQRVPNVFSYLQQILDEQAEPGRFVFTGSQQFGLMQELSQSLAGRSGLLTLLPFSHQELIRGGFPAVSLAERILKGGYPPVYDPGAPAEAWLNAYIATYIERDVRQLLEIRNLQAFRTFMKLCAGSVGQEVNLTRLGGDCGVDQGTIRQWLSVLEASYVIYRLPAHVENFRKRVVKRPKLVFLDTGVAARLIGLETPEQWVSHPLRGALFENWVISERLKCLWNKGKRPELFYWRENNGLEVDLIQEEGGLSRPVEIKSGATFTKEWVKGLQRWCALAGERAGSAELVYGGEESFEFKGIHIRSWKEM